MFHFALQLSRLPQRAPVWSDGVSPSKEHGNATAPEWRCPVEPPWSLTADLWGLACGQSSGHTSFEQPGNRGAGPRRL